VVGKDSAAAYLHEGMIAARTLMLESIRPSTASHYRQAYSHWENFCKAADISPLPAQPDHLSACLAVVASETRSVSAVEAIYATGTNWKDMNLPPRVLLFACCYAPSIGSLASLVAR
jgi:hypothetical protein